MRIVAPHFVAGIEADQGRVVRAAPILAYMLGWSGAQVAAYCRRRGWSWERLGETSPSPGAETPAEATSGTP